MIQDFVPISNATRSRHRPSSIAEATHGLRESIRRGAVGMELGAPPEAGKLPGNRQSPSAVDLHRELNTLKKKPVQEGGIPWMYEVSKCAPQEALRDLDRAY